jgi:hypothetical protein
VAGGDENAIEAAGAGAARYATIAGGVNNRVSGLGATAGGGDQNSVSGPFAVVPGGRTNTAAGTGSFAAGISALALHDGAFVWSDGAGTTAVKSSAPYQFVARASGGFYLYSNAAATSGVRLAPGSGAWASLSDRGAKTHVVAVDDEALLAEVGNLPVGTWSYRSEDPRIRHVGPMAQDFHKAFGVGDDDRHITSIDEAGVVLAATKALRNHDLAFYDQESGRQAELRALRDGIARVARLASADAPPQHAARKIRRRRGGASPITCSTVASGAFVAIPYYGDYAASLSGIGGGTGNTACDSNDGILAGQQNAIGDAGNAGVSAVGAGNQNAITAAQVMIGAGTLNSVEGSGAFIGAGELNEASGYLAFVGGGGVNDAATPADGNVASGTGSFVGAGDLNRASGMGSFIGAGGAATPHSDGLTGNAVSGNDALIGAGEQNLVAGSTGAVVAGFRNQASGAGAFVGAGDLNVASGAGAVVGGGGTADANISAPQNVAAGVDAFVGAGDENYIGALALASVAVGGAGNSIDAPYGAIGGGAHNAIGAQNFAGAALFDVIAGGDDNAIEATVSGGARYATIVGGAANRVSAQGATVGGGTQNRVSGLYAVVPGGRATAAGTGSFAAGISALALHDGTFVWSDGASPTAVKSSAPYQFVARSSGGFFLYSNASATAGVRLAPGSGAWASLGDRAAATALVAVDDAAVLAKVGELPVSAWSYRSEDPRVRHVGPMAQDFYEAFGVGEDDRHIASIDEDGVALAATKALRDEDLALRDQSRELRAELRELRAGLSRVRRLVGGTRVARLGG